MKKRKPKVTAETKRIARFQSMLMDVRQRLAQAVEAAFTLEQELHREMLKAQGRSNQ